METILAAIGLCIGLGIAVLVMYALVLCFCVGFSIVGGIFYCAVYALAAPFVALGLIALPRRKNKQRDNLMLGDDPRHYTNSRYYPRIQKVVE